MKENQATLEKTKNENLEAVKRLGVTAMTLAKLGFKLLKKVPWAKVSTAVLVPIGLLISEIVLRFADAFVETIAEHDFSAEEELESEARGGAWLDVDGEVVDYDHGGLMKIG